MTVITRLAVSVMRGNLQPYKSCLLENALQNCSEHLGSNGNRMSSCITSSSARLFCLHFYLLYKLIKMGIACLTHSTGTLKKNNPKNKQKPRTNWFLLLLLTEFAFLFQNNRVNHNCWWDSLYLGESHWLTLTLRSVKFLKITSIDNLGLELQQKWQYCRNENICSNRCSCLFVGSINGIMQHAPTSRNTLSASYAFTRHDHQILQLSLFM